MPSALAAAARRRRVVWPADSLLCLFSWRNDRCAPSGRLYLRRFYEDNAEDDL